MTTAIYTRIMNNFKTHNNIEITDSKPSLLAAKSSSVDTAYTAVPPITDLELTLSHDCSELSIHSQTDSPGCESYAVIANKEAVESPGLTIESTDSTAELTESTGSTDPASTTRRTCEDSCDQKHESTKLSNNWQHAVECGSMTNFQFDSDVQESNSGQALTSAHSTRTQLSEDGRSNPSCGLDKTPCCTVGCIVPNFADETKEQQSKWMDQAMQVPLTDEDRQAIRDYEQELLIDANNYLNRLMEEAQQDIQDGVQEMDETTDTTDNGTTEDGTTGNGTTATAVQDTQGDFFSTIVNQCMTRPNIPESVFINGLTQLTNSPDEVSNRLRETMLELGLNLMNLETDPTFRDNFKSFMRVLLCLKHKINSRHLCFIVKSFVFGAVCPCPTMADSLPTDTKRHVMISRAFVKRVLPEVFGEIGQAGLIKSVLKHSLRKMKSFGCSAEANKECKCAQWRFHM